MWSHDGPRSLRSQLTLALAIAFFGVHYAVRAQLLEWSKTRLEKRIDALADFAARNPGRESAADSMLDFRSRAHEDFFEIRDAGGRLLARSQSSRGLALPSRAAAIAEYGPMYSLRLPDGHPGLALSRRVALPADDPRGHFVIAVASESVRLQVLERRIHGTLLAFAIVTVVATTLVTTLVTRRALAPLTRLARHAERIDPDGARTTLLTDGLPRKLAALADKLSDLLRRLFDARDRERRLTRSVAHELRTPVA
jgi:two-component system sensor histidine kinase QseC